MVDPASWSARIYHDLPAQAVDAEVETQLRGEEELYFRVARDGKGLSPDPGKGLWGWFSLRG